MKNAFSYIASVIASVLLVFCILASVISVIGYTSVNEKKFKSIAASEHIDEKVCSELGRYFKERSSASGIPAEVYMNAIDSEYVSGIVDQKIDNGFHCLRGGNQSIDLSNAELDASIERFFNDYADSINYEKDEKFAKKVDAAKKSAYRIIDEFSDVYKFGALEEHGVLSKVSKLYTKLDVIMTGSVAASVVLVIILLLLNLSSKSATVYWTGVSSLIAGIIGLAPTAYLLATDYFSSFSIKQPQIFTAYTSTLTMLTKTFMFASVGAAAAGIVLIIVYIIIKPKNKASAAA